MVSLFLSFFFLLIFGDLRTGFGVVADGEGCSPGRFHVSVVVKLVAGEFVRRFDCEFEEGARMNVEFRDVLVPDSGCRVVVRKREEGRNLG